MSRHGPWHPILHNSVRPLKQRDPLAKCSQYAPPIPNDYTWYRPLDITRKEIRILFLEPEPIDSIKDVVVHVFNASPLDPNVKKLYGCLSYCWGDPRNTKVIEVNYSEKRDGGLTTTKTAFRVTSNLEAALRVLRSTLIRQVMWVDAICIDQSDIEERNSQVPLMCEIYPQAMQTLIWLGESDSTTKMVFDFGDLIAAMEVKPQEVDSNTVAAGIRCDRLRPLAKGQVQFLKHEVASDSFYMMRWGIQAILSRPFFRRAWVLQEVGLADQEQAVIFCGSYSLRWGTFLNLTTFEWRAAASQGRLKIDYERDKRLGLPSPHSTLNPGSSYKLPEIWNYLKASCSTKKRGNILDLIVRRLEVEATDPRDHVYALFGLASECQGTVDRPQGFCADYSRSLVETYNLFTRAVIETTHNLIVLSEVDTFDQSGTRQQRELPSWVPEYDRHINLRQTFGFLGQGHYRASGNLKPEIFSSDPHSLLLSGIIVDQVSQDRAWGPYLMIMDIEDDINAAKVTDLSIEGSQGGLALLWNIVSERIHQNPIAGQDLLESFILALICCRRESWNRPVIKLLSDIPNILADLASYWLMFNPDGNSFPNTSKLYSSGEEFIRLASTGDARNFGQRLFYTCNKRSFLITERGLLAIVPRRTRNGDLIVVFPGANVPHVIRRIREGDTQSTLPKPAPKFEFIGECYVHGRMQGSAVVEVENGSLKVEKLNLV